MRGYATESGLAARPATLLLAIAALLLIAPAQGCGDGSGRNDAASGFRGVMLEPGPRPDFTLTDTRGRPFDFRRETDGKVALLFFGYTHCPDVCRVQIFQWDSTKRDAHCSEVLMKAW